MKLLQLTTLLFIVVSIFSCGTVEKKCQEKYPDVQATGIIEITNYTVEKMGTQTCSVHGRIIDEYEEPLIGMTIHIENPIIGTAIDFDGNFDLREVPPGTHTFIFRFPGLEESTVTLELAPGDRINLDGIIGPYDDIQLEKPIIYLYPEVTTEVHISLDYDGDLTTTYPQYPKDGWKITAHPDGTLYDQNGKEYYSLYWEGKSREALKINDGFVVPKEETIPFLEEKLTVLGLNPREANEFIIFWLPTLEKNAYNVIHFSGEDYLQQAQLNVTPAPETMIRVAMVFQGLDAAINIPEQDLSPLAKSRKGFTVVEWGGQELPKSFTVGM